MKNKINITVLVAAGILSLHSQFAQAGALTIPSLPTSFPLKAPTNAGTLIVATGSSENLPGADNIVQASGSVGGTFGLKSDGTIKVWNYSPLYSYPGETNVPANATNIVQIAAGEHHVLALRADGVVIAWGANKFGQTTVPVGLTNVVQVAAGEDASLALKSDGTVVAWGFELDTNTPASLTNIVQIAVGDQFMAALKNDGTVVAWGRDTYDQTNTAGLTNVVQITAAAAAVLALQADGTTTNSGSPYNQLTNCVQLSARGNKAYGLLNDGTIKRINPTTIYQSENISDRAKSIFQISVGFGHTTALIPTKVNNNKITPFAPIPNKTFGSAPFTIKLPVASSGLPVSVTVTSGPASILTNRIALTGAGTVTLTATQLGDSTYWDATPVTTSFVVGKAKQTISFFGKLSPMTWDAQDSTNATPVASSGLPVTVAVKSGPASVFQSGTNYVISPWAPGLVVLAASQAGDTNYLAATDVTAVLLVNKATQTLSSWGSIPTQAKGVTQFDNESPINSSGSFQQVHYKVKSGPAKLVNGMDTQPDFELTGKGTVVLSAYLPGDGYFLPSKEQTVSFQVK